MSYHDFEAADMAIENMNGQFLGGKQITVQYAFKKDGKGERHGTQAERLLAAQAKSVQVMPKDRKKAADQAGKTPFWAAGLVRDPRHTPIKAGPRAA